MNPLNTNARPTHDRDASTAVSLNGVSLMHPWSRFGLLVVLAFLIVGGVIGYVNGRQLDENRHWVTHTHEVLRSLQTLLTTLVDAETGQRGWLLTEEVKYLAPYEAAVAQVDDDIARVKSLIADNPAQLARFAQLEPKIAERLERILATVQLVRDGKRDEAIEFLRMGRGRELMLEIRQGVADMTSREQQLLRERDERSNSSYYTLLVSNLLITVAGLVLVGSLFQLGHRYAIQQQRAAQLVSQQKEQLRITLASIGDAVIATNERGHVTYLNSVAEQLTGWSQADAAGQPLTVVFNIVNETTRTPVSNPALRALKEGVVVGLANHTVLIARDGREWPIDDSAAPIRDEFGHLSGAVLVFRDITERKQLETAQAERHRLLALRAEVKAALVAPQAREVTLQRSCELLAKSLDLKAARIWTRDDSRRQLDRQANAGSDGPSPAGADHVALDDSSLGRIIASGQTRVADLTRDPRALDDLPEIQALGAVTYVALPLQVENRIVGLLEIAAAQPLGEEVMAELTPLAGGFAQYIERKATEERLRQQSELYRTTLHSIGDAVITTDVQGRVTHLNELAESLTGWSSASAAGQPLDAIFQIVNESTRLPVENPATRALAEGVVVGLANHTVLMARDGSEHPIEDSAAPIRAADGTVVGCVLVFRDVTERRGQERELLARELQFRTLVNNSPDLVARLDRDLRHIFVSSASVAILGIEPDALLGKTSLECGWSRELWDAFVGRCREAEQTRLPVTFEFTNEQADGLKHFVARIVPELTTDDQLGSYLVLTTDVTGRMQVAEELRQSLEETRTLLETLPVGVFIAHDREARHITGNRTAHELLRAHGPNLSKTAPDDAAPRHFRVCRNGVEIPPHDLPVQRAARGETVLNEEVDDVFDDGTVIHTVISAAPLFDRTGQARGAVASVLDVTEQKRAEESLRESQRFLRSSLDALESHIAVIDATGVILEVNAAWRNFAQANQFVGSEYGVGANYLDVCDAWRSECGEGQAIASGLRDIIAGKRDRFRFEYPCHSPAEQRWFLMQATRFQSPGPVRVVVAHENVTERRLAEEALHVADRRKDEFLATLAHELRNPLAPIRNGLHILHLAGNDPASSEHARSMIDRQLSQLVRLVDDL
ncbi:MAG: PAS domain S-box protein, partial [Planctomycetaceae bacterium]|nr:PAS domain S-box protein [Planctomycetaceae bacterium]